MLQDYLEEHMPLKQEGLPLPQGSMPEIPKIGPATALRSFSIRLHHNAHKYTQNNWSRIHLHWYEAFWGNQKQNHVDNIIPL